MSSNLAKIGSRLGRCDRYLDRCQKDAASILQAQAADDQADFTVEVIKATIASIEEETSDLKVSLEEYETAIAESGVPIKEAQQKEIEDASDKLFESRPTVRKLRARLETLTGRINTPFSRSASRAAAASRVSSVLSGPISRSAEADDPPTHSQQWPEDADPAESEAGSHAASSNKAAPNQQTPVSDIQAGQKAPESGSAGADLVNQIFQKLLSATPGHSSKDDEALVRLPKFSLPKFSGDAEEWQSFWDQFEQAVGNRSSLSEVQKLQYLLPCLEGDAAKFVSGLPLINKNYEVAVGMLRDQFGNPNVAMEKIYSKLVDMKAVPPRDTRKLREFYFQLESCLRRLEVLDADASGNHMVAILLKKLPIYVVTQLERAKGSKTQWTIQLLRKLLSEELEIQEAASRRQDADHQEKKPPHPPNINGTGKSGGRKTTEAFKAQEKGPPSSRSGAAKQPGPPPATPRKPSCFFCKAEHWSNECKKLATADQRRELVRQQKCCFICLSNRHQAKFCQSEKPCFHCKRIRLHHSSLCPNQYSRGSTSDTSNRSEDVRDLSNGEDVGALASDEHAVMKTAVCDALNPDDSTVESEEVSMFFDSGTSRTWVRQDVAQKLGLKMGRKRTLLVNTFANAGGPKSIEMREAKLILRSSTGQRWKLTVAVTHKALGQMSLFNKSAIKPLIPSGLKLADPVTPSSDKVDIDIMIGNDYYDDLVFGEKVQISAGLWLLSSAFGWIMSGRVSDQFSQRTRAESSMYAMAETFDAVDRNAIKDLRLDDLGSLEVIGIKDSPNDITDDQVVDHFNKTVKFEDGRYQVTWPYIQDSQTLPRNEEIAKRRLCNMVTRYQSNQKHEFLQKYDDIIQYQAANGIIEVVPDNEAQSSFKVHYLPHHGVETPGSETTKLRIVYNASARRTPESPSLNDCLYRGEVFLENLVILLLRFRLHPVAIVADIEKAFLQVGLQQSERDVTRFFWLRDITKPPDSANLVTYRFTRVSFGVKSSPFLLGATILHHLRGHPSETSSLIENGLYVDNVVTGVGNREAATAFYTESKKLFRTANMNLRQFASSDAGFLDSIPKEDRTDSADLKVLGVKWSCITDTLAVSSTGSEKRAIKPAKQKMHLSKRVILSTTFRVYDPLGFACPVSIQGRIFLQQLNKKKLHWDEKLPPELEDKWLQIQATLDDIQTVSIDRYLGFSLAECNQLMCFCDASAAAYAAVIYLQNVTDTQIKSRMVFAKARVSPLKKMTIPRLELMAVWLGTRIIGFLQRSLPYSGKCIIWSDSQCVLRWIQDKHTIKTAFVQNRLREIRACTDAQFQYVPSEQNPADVASRGCDVSGLTTLWWEGPDFIKDGEDSWPTWEGQVSTGTIPDEEDTAMPSTEQLPSIPPFGIDVSRYSSWKKLARVTALCFRFISRLQKTSDQHQSQYLHPDEIQKAARAWIKHAQQVSYPHQFSRAGKGNAFQMQLGVKVDPHGLLRCHGRLANMATSNDTKYPLLLPSKSDLTNLIIADSHQKSLHAGTNQTLGQIRQEFWIPHARTRIKSVIHKCITCRRYQGQAFQRPQMPELPAERTVQSQPFESTGLDYFGPLYVKGEQEPVKRWVCIFTCLSTRAIHLEMVEDMSAEHFLLALRRFISRRRTPRNVWSDNATQFRAVKLAKPLAHALAAEEISWKFTPEYAPWAGGIYERLIRCVKSTLKKTLGKSLLKSEHLRTILTEVENSVNSRPLTYISDDINSWKVITPNDFLGTGAQRSILALDDQTTDTDFMQSKPSTRETLVALYKAHANRLEEVWNVWQKDYLLSLRESTRYGHKDPRGKVQRSPLIGDVVIVKDARYPRGNWKTAIITETIKSGDGAIRSAKVRMPHGATLVRPVNLLYPLEADSSRPSSQPGPTSKHAEKLPLTDGSIEQPTNRPRRKAADRALSKIRDQLNDGDSDLSPGV